MKIPSLEKAAALIAASAPPDCDQSVALSEAVGIALAMATPLQNLGDPSLASLSRAELINIIGNKQQVYSAIDRCNECVLLCVDTAVRTFTKAFLFRLEIARGNPGALSFARQCCEYTDDAVQVLYPEFCELLQV